MDHRALRPLLRHAMTAALVLATAATGSARADTNVGVDSADGVVARATFVPHASEAGVGELTLELRDAATNQPLDYSGRRLAGWLQHRPPTLADGEVACSDKVRALASQGIGRRAAVDFNTYGLVTLNSDRTLAFINPFLRLNNAKLEAVLSLPGDASALLHHARAHELWVAMPASDSVAVIDTDTQRLKRSIVFAAGSGPQALALDGDAVWVAFAGRSAWLRFDRSSSTTPDARVEAPAGARLVAAGDGRHLIGVHAGGATLLDGATLATQTLADTAAPLATTWSALAQRWIVAHADGRLAWVDPTDGRTEHEQLLPAPATRLLAFDGGRHAVALMPAREQAAIVDLATPQLLQTATVVPEAEDISLSAGFIYVHSPSRAMASLLALPEARAGRARAIHVAIGAVGAASAPAEAALGLVSNTPDGSGMLIASRHDGQIYQYAEGMMAPIGSFSNYKRSARALLVLNHGFESLGAGRYRATVRHSQGGTHELVLSGVQPRFAQCLPLALPQVPDARAERLAARPQARLLGVAAQPGSDLLAVDVQLEDRATREAIVAVADLVLLAFDKRSGWQRRSRLVEQAPGRYRATLSDAPPGQAIELLVSSASQDLPFGGSLIGHYERPAP